MKTMIIDKVSAWTKGIVPFCLLAAMPLLDSCKSGDPDFPNFDYQTTYFAKQYPVRTVELGNDEYVDLSLDNQHKIQIQAAMGGAYNNPQDINISIAVDQSLCTGMTFADGTDVTPMPSNYYTLASNNITIPEGQVTGGVEVFLTDAFFADPLSTTLHYVIPVKMTGATGVDHILEGKDFVLYAVKYVNRYHAQYILNNNYQDIVSVTTKDLNTALYVYGAKDAKGKKHNCEMELTFAADGTCTIAPSAAAAAAGFTATGTGRFVEADGSQLLGARHPDTMYLTFHVTYSDHSDNDPAEWVDVDVSESQVLMVQTRGIKSELFIQQ